MDRFVDLVLDTKDQTDQPNRFKYLEEPGGWTAPNRFKYLEVPTEEELYTAAKGAIQKRIEEERNWVQPKAQLAPTAGVSIGAPATRERTYRDTVAEEGMNLAPWIDVDSQEIVDPKTGQRRPPTDRERQTMSFAASDPKILGLIPNEDFRTRIVRANAKYNQGAIEKGLWATSGWAGRALGPVSDVLAKIVPALGRPEAELRALEPEGATPLELGRTFAGVPMTWGIGGLVGKAAGGVISALAKTPLGSSVLNQTIQGLAKRSPVLAHLLLKTGTHAAKGAAIFGSYGVLNSYLNDMPFGQAVDHVTQQALLGAAVGGAMGLTGAAATEARVAQALKGAFRKAGCSPQQTENYLRMFRDYRRAAMSARGQEWADTFAGKVRSGTATPEDLEAFGRALQEYRPVERPQLPGPRLRGQPVTPPTGRPIITPSPTSMPEMKPPEAGMPPEIKAPPARPVQEAPPPPVVTPVTPSATEEWGWFTDEQGRKLWTTTSEAERQHLRVSTYSPAEGERTYYSVGLASADTTHLPKSEDFLYHYTPVEYLEQIKKSGLRPQGAPLSRSHAESERNYIFALRQSDPDLFHNAIERDVVDIEGDWAILRIPNQGRWVRDAAFVDPQNVAIKARRRISVDNIDVLTADGWLPLRNLPKPEMITEAEYRIRQVQAAAAEGARVPPPTVVAPPVVEPAVAAVETGPPTPASARVAQPSRVTPTPILAVPPEWVDDLRVKMSRMVELQRRLESLGPGEERQTTISQIKVVNDLIAKTKAKGKAKLGIETFNRIANQIWAEVKQVAAKRVITPTAVASPVPEVPHGLVREARAYLENVDRIKRKIARATGAEAANDATWLGGTDTVLRDAFLKEHQEHELFGDYLRRISGDPNARYPKALPFIKDYPQLLEGPTGEPTPLAKVAVEPPAPVVTKGAPREAPEIAPPLPEDQVLLNVDEIGVDPKRFQFKAAGKGAEGITEAMKGVKVWGKIKAGAILVWRDDQGRDWVVDGHHRVALAKRLGQSTIRAWVLREEDGVTEAQARVQGALNNLANDKGTAVDGAKVFRESDISLKELEAEGVPVNNEKVRQGLAMKNLSDDVFRFVVEGRLEPRHAAAIGEMLDEPLKQMTAAKAVMEGEGKTQRESEIIAAAVRQGPVLREEDKTLFGTEVTETVLYAERAKVQANVENRLVKERKVFGVLQRQPEMIETAGNILAREENISRVQAAREALELFQKLADKKGEVSDDLNEAAIAYHKDHTPQGLDRITSQVIQKWSTGLPGVFPVNERAAGPPHGEVERPAEAPRPTEVPRVTEPSPEIPGNAFSGPLGTGRGERGAVAGGPLFPEPTIKPSTRRAIFAALAAKGISEKRRRVILEQFAPESPTLAEGKIAERRALEFLASIENLPKEHPIVRGFVSPSPAFNELVGYYESLTVPKGAKTRKIERQIRQVQGMARARLTSPAAANKAVASLRKRLIATAEKEGIALVQGPGGQLRPNVRKAGTFVPIEFAKWPRFKDVRGMFGGTKDITRLVEEIDGSLTAREAVKLPGQMGPLEQFLLMPVEDITILRQHYYADKQHELARFLGDVKPNSPLDKTITAVLREISTEMGEATFALPLLEDQLIRELANMPAIQAITTDESIVRRAVGVRQSLDMMLDEQNLMRALRGQEPIPHLENYSPEILRNYSIWEQLGHARIEAKDLPPLPDYIIPNKPFNPRELAREGGIPYEEQVQSSVDLLRRYIGTAGRDAFNTTIIQVGKPFVNQLEAMGKPNSARAIETWLAEGFGGVAPMLDRYINAPGWMKRGMRGINRYRNMAVFPSNLAWMLEVQPTSLALTWMRFGLPDTIRGFCDYILSPRARFDIKKTYAWQMKAEAGARMTHQDLSAVMGNDLKIYKSWKDVLQNFSVFFLDEMEKLCVGTSIQAGYINGRRRGYRGRALEHYASMAGGKTQSMYNDEDKPAILRSLAVKTVLPFQTFACDAMNTIKETFGRTGMPPDRKLYAAWMLVRLMAASTVINMLVRKLGRRDVWDPFVFVPFSELILTPVAVFRALTGKKRDLQVRGRTTGIAPLDTLTDVAVATADIVNKPTSPHAYDNLRRIMTQYVPSFFGIPGGIQGNRMIDAGIAYAQGGRFDKNGKLMFKIQGLEDLLRGLYGGVWRTKGGQAYLRRGNLDEMTRQELAAYVMKNTDDYGVPHKGFEDKVKKARARLAKMRR